MSELQRAAFCKPNLIPIDAALEFDSFLDFYQKRKYILRTELRKALAKAQVPAGDGADWAGRDDEIEDLVEAAE